MTMVPTSKHLLLHAGMHKTGTTALQVFLAGNTIGLAQVGIHYPISGRHHEGPLVSAGHHFAARESFEAVLETALDRSVFALRDVAVNERFAIDIPFVAERDIAMSDADEGRAQAHRALLAAVLERLD